MKHLFTSMILLLFIGSVNCQQTEYFVNFNSGLFHYTGISAEATEQINYSLKNERGYTNNPYGSKFGMSYGLSMSVQRINQSNVILGTDLGYGVLRSKINIDAVWQHGDDINETVSAEGRTFLNTSFINLFPFIGYRFNRNQFDLDIECGIDVGYILKSVEHGEASSATRQFKTELERETIDTDIRPRIQLTLYKNRFGIYLGYAKGLNNYRKDIIGGRWDAKSEMIRFGFKYRVV